MKKIVISICIVLLILLLVTVERWYAKQSRQIIPTYQASYFEYMNFINENDGVIYVYGNNIKFHDDASCVYIDSMDEFNYKEIDSRYKLLIIIDLYSDIQLSENDLFIINEMITDDWSLGYYGVNYLDEINEKVINPNFNKKITYERGNTGFYYENYIYDYSFTDVGWLEEHTEMNLSTNDILLSEEILRRLKYIIIEAKYYENKNYKPYEDI